MSFFVKKSSYNSCKLDRRHDHEGQGRDPKMFCAQFLKTAGDTDLIAMEYL